MNKSKLILAVQKNLGSNTTKAIAERAVKATIDAIKAGIRDDKTVQLIGFGTFNVTKLAGRMGVNPQTSEPMKINESWTVKFKPGQALKDSI